MILNQTVDDADQKVDYHSDNKDLPYKCDPWFLLRSKLWPIFEQSLFLFFYCILECFYEFWHDWANEGKNVFNVMLGKTNDDEKALDQYFDYCFSNHTGGKESRKWYKKMATCEAS